MSVKDIFAIAASIILSVGGSGALICALSKFLAERIANRIDKKYQQRIDQELEKYRNVIEHKKYVSQTQFDYEFQIYKQLSKAYFAVAVKASSFAHNYKKYQTISVKEGDISKEELFKIIDLNYNSQNLLFENAAFIPEDIYNAYYELNEMTNAFFWKIIDRVKEFPTTDYGLRDINLDCDLESSIAIETKLAEINKMVRAHLELLAIIQNH